MNTVNPNQANQFEYSFKNNFQNLPMIDPYWRYKTSEIKPYE